MAKDVPVAGGRQRWLFPRLGPGAGAPDACHAVGGLGRMPGPDLAWQRAGRDAGNHQPLCAGDRKSTRLNSSHLVISYAVFCLKKKEASPTAPRRRSDFGI